MASFFADVAQIERRVVPVELGQMVGEFGQAVVDVRPMSIGRVVVLLKCRVQAVPDGVLVQPLLVHRVSSSRPLQ